MSSDSMIYQELADIRFKRKLRLIKAVSFLILSSALLVFAFIFIFKDGSMDLNFSDKEFKAIFDSNKEELVSVEKKNIGEIKELREMLKDPSIPGNVKDSVMKLIRYRTDDLEKAKYLLDKFEYVQTGEDKHVLLKEVLDFLSFKLNPRNFVDYTKIIEKMMNDIDFKNISNELELTKEELESTRKELDKILFSNSDNIKLIKNLQSIIRKRELSMDSLLSVNQKINERNSELISDMTKFKGEISNLKDTIKTQIPFNLANCTFRIIDCKSKRDGAYKYRCVDSLLLRFKTLPESGRNIKEIKVTVNFTYARTEGTQSKNTKPSFKKDVIVKVGQYTDVVLKDTELKLLPGFYTANIIYNHNGNYISLNVLDLSIKKGLF